MSESKDEDMSDKPLTADDTTKGAVNIMCDLTSEWFDAESSLLLDTDQVVIPVTSAHTFNNIDEYYNKSFGKQLAAKQLSDGQSSSSAPVIPFKRTLVIEGCVSTRGKRRELNTVLTKMKTSATKGPLALLHRSLNHRIKVLIRRRRSVKVFGGRFGWVCGVLIAFDKHHNLCMCDVDEKYQTLDHNNQTRDVCNHIKQVFIRGDNVVLISFV